MWIEQASMQVSDRSCAKKGGFKLIGFALLEVTNHLGHLLLLGSTNHFGSKVIYGNDTGLAHGANPGTREKDGHNPQTQVLKLQPPRRAAQPTEGVVGHNVSIGGLPHGFSCVGFGWPGFAHA